MPTVCNLEAPKSWLIRRICENVDYAPRCETWFSLANYGEEATRKMITKVNVVQVVSFRVRNPLQFVEEVPGSTLVHLRLNDLEEIHQN